MLPSVCSSFWSSSTHAIGTSLHRVFTYIMAVIRNSTHNYNVCENHFYALSKQNENSTTLSVLFKVLAPPPIPKILLVHSRGLINIVVNKCGNEFKFQFGDGHGVRMAQAEQKVHVSLCEETALQYVFWRFIFSKCIFLPCVMTVEHGFPVSGHWGPTI